MQTARRTALGLALACVAGCSASARPTTTGRTTAQPFASHAAAPSANGQVRTILISVSRFGDQGDGDSADPTISADGRYVAFVSGTDDLVAGDTNGRDDIFVRDTKTGTTRRINVSPEGVQGNGIRLIPATASIDGDGRYVAFQTDDSNLVAGPPNPCTVIDPGRQQCPEIYVRDLRAGTTRIVSVSDDGARANGLSEFPVISENGRYVAFVSGASNLVPGDTNDTWDVFVADLQTGTIQRVDVSSTGAQSDSSSYWVAISADGRYVAFTSSATTLAAGKPDKRSIGVFVRDRQTGTTKLVGIYGVPAQDDYGQVWISPNGRYVAFDTRTSLEISVRDMQTGTVKSMSQPAGLEGSGIAGDELNGDLAISADERYVAFTSSASNLLPQVVLPGPEIFERGPLS